jgi:hypothetical protein
MHGDDWQQSTGGRKKREKRKKRRKLKKLNKMNLETSGPTPD